MFCLEKWSKFQKLCQNMLTTLRSIYLYYKLQVCFQYHLHCMTFTCHIKDSWTSNRPKIKFFWENIKLYIPHIFSVLYVCLIVPYYYKKNQHQRVFRFENQGPLCEINNVWWNTYSTLKVLCSNQNSKSKDSMVQFRFFYIHINHKT